MERVRINSSGHIELTFTALRDLIWHGGDYPHDWMEVIFDALDTLTDDCWESCRGDYYDGFVCNL